MTRTAQSDEILFHIVAQVASSLNVMDMEILRASALLASPAIAREHLLTKRPIEILVQAKPRPSCAG